MNETIKTNTGSPWSSSIAIIFIGFIVLLLMMYTKFYLHMRFHDISIAIFNPLSIDLWFAGYNTLRQTIAEVNGQPLSIIKLGTYFSMFISFLFLFVVNPILFIYSRGKINVDKLDQKKSSLIVRMGFFVSFAILIVIPANTIASAIASNSVLDEFKKTSDEQKYEQVNVKSELSKIIFKAQQYYILPVEEGGGGKSFLKNNKLITLSDLGFEEIPALGRTILYQQKSDTILYLYFFGLRISSKNTKHDPEFFRAVAYEATISPSNHNITIKPTMTINY